MAVATNGVVAVGDALPDLALPLLGGGELAFRDLRGSRLLLYFWGSWWRCRAQLPGWQRFFAAHRGDGFALVSVAVEHLGAEAARPYVEAAGAGFPTAVDDRGLSVGRFGFTVVPNGVLVDEAGTVRWLKHGGFSVDNPEDVAAVERFLAGQEPPAATDGTTVPYALGPTERELVAKQVRLGELLLGLGRRDEAVEEWRSALRRDPENFLIRKQIWAIEHPERFHPAIDFAWQQERLRQEREAEVAAGICGPDGCPVPWAGGAAA